jgi:hypothetical protein
MQSGMLSTGMQSADALQSTDALRRPMIHSRDPLVVIYCRL